MAKYHDSLTDWEFVKTLGSGAFGEVSLWTKSHSGQSVAIKRCTVDLSVLDPDERNKLQSRWLKEAGWVEQIDIEYIVRACPDKCPDLVAEQNRTANLPVIVMEYCDGGNLRSQLQQIENVNGLSEHVVRQVLFALGKAIFYLHERYKIAHRDIKPDNIVIKYDSYGNPTYKLTDMGYARIIDRNTIIGSMVGTRNYFAPEIVQTAEYKNSVDYWSVGIVAFEIICGVYPFLQDQTMFEVMESINKKPAGCIAITKSSEGRLVHHTRLFSENRLCAPFRKSIEEWLALALETDGRKRGYEAPDELHIPKLKFFSKLELALNSEILTLFWLNGCQFLSYNVNELRTMDALDGAIQRDTGFGLNNFYFVLPAGHSLNCLRPDMTPIDLFDKRFAAANKPMLYLVDFSGDGLCNPRDPVIPEAVRLLFSQQLKLEPRMLKKCMLDSLFLYHIEQQRVNAFFNGCNEFLMHLEDDIMRETKGINEYHERIVHINGQAAQYEIMVSCGKHLLLDEETSKDDVVRNDCEMFAQNLKSQYAKYLHVRSSFASLLDGIRDIMNKSPLATYQEDVALQVKEFEDFFEKVRDKSHAVSIGDILQYVSQFLKVRKDFFDCSKKWLQKQESVNNETVTNSTSDSLVKIYTQFAAIKRTAIENRLSWNLSKEAITEKTKDYLQNFAKWFHTKGVDTASLTVISERMDTLDLATDMEDSLVHIPADSVISQSQMLAQALKSLYPD